jgi:predicted metal-binding membrane protein
MAGATLQALARTQRAVLLGSTAFVTLAAWLWMNLDPGAHSRAAFLLPHCHAGAGAASFLAAAAMWQGMSVAMMAPTTLNWLFAYTVLTSQDSTAGVFRAVCTFLGGYFSVWLVYSAGAAALQIALQRAGSLDGEGKLPPVIAGLLLMGAGIAYFTPLSRACLKHCRNPMTYFASHWDNGPRSGFRFGAAHAVYCVGCCWLLMLTGFAMGVMNMIWMAFLTVLVAVEKLAPRGERVATFASAALILWGAALLLGIPPGKP